MYQYNLIKIIAFALFFLTSTCYWSLVAFLSYKAVLISKLRSEGQFRSAKPFHPTPENTLVKNQKVIFFTKHLLIW